MAKTKKRARLFKVDYFTALTSLIEGLVEDEAAQVDEDEDYETLTIGEKAITLEELLEFAKKSAEQCKANSEKAKGKEKKPSTKSKSKKPAQTAPETLEKYNTIVQILKDADGPLSATQIVEADDSLGVKNRILVQTVLKRYPDLVAKKGKVSQEKYKNGELIGTTMVDGYVYIGE